MPRGIRADISTVCVDADYYQFPSEKWIGGVCAQVPDHFRFGFKVTHEITIKKFQNLPRFGSRPGTANSNFLNPELFERNFLTKRTSSMGAILWWHWINSSAHFRSAGTTGSNCATRRGCCRNTPRHCTGTGSRMSSIHGPECRLSLSSWRCRTSAGSIHRHCMGHILPHCITRQISASARHRVWADHRRPLAPSNHR